MLKLAESLLLGRLDSLKGQLQSFGIWLLQRLFWLSRVFVIQKTVYGRASRTQALCVLPDMEFKCVVVVCFVGLWPKLKVWCMQLANG